MSLTDHWLPGGDETHAMVDAPDPRDSGQVLLAPALRASMSSIPPSPSDSLPQLLTSPRDSLTNELRAAMGSLPPPPPAGLEPRGDLTPLPSVDTEDAPHGKRRGGKAVALTLAVLVAGSAAAAFTYGPRIRAAAPWLPLPDVLGVRLEEPLPSSTAEPEALPQSAAAQPVPAASVAEPIDAASGLAPAASATAPPLSSAAAGPAPSQTATPRGAPPPRGPWPPARPAAPARTAQEPAPAAAPTDPPSKLKNPFE